MLRAEAASVNSMRAHEYVQGTLITALCEDFSGDEYSSERPGNRRGSSRDRLAAAAAERWQRPFRSNESPALHAFMCQCRQAGRRKTARSKGLWVGRDKAAIRQAAYKVLGLDASYLLWSDEDYWHGCHEDLDRPVKLSELYRDGKPVAGIVVYEPDTFDEETGTFTNGCHLISPLAIGASVAWKNATARMRNAINALRRARVAVLEADAAGSMGKVKNPLCEGWDIMVLRDEPFGSFAELGAAAGITKLGKYRRGAVSDGMAVGSQGGIRPMLSTLAGAILREHGGSAGFAGGVEEYVTAVITKALEMLGTTADRERVCKTAGACARRKWRTFRPELMGKPRKPCREGIMRQSLDAKGIADGRARQSASGAARAERARKETWQTLRDAMDRCVWRAKGEWLEVSQADVAAGAGVSVGTIRRHWSDLRKWALGVAEKRRMTTIQRPRRCSLKKTESLRRKGYSPTSPADVKARMIQETMKRVAESLPRGRYAPPSPITAVVPSLAQVFPTAMVSRVQLPRIPARTWEAVMDDDRVPWDD